MAARSETGRPGFFAATPEEGFPAVGLALGLALALFAAFGLGVCHDAFDGAARLAACGLLGLALGAAFGGILAPALSSSILADKEAKIRAHNEAKLSEYAAFKAAHPDREPSAAADAAEDALAAWRRGAIASIKGGTWPREWAEAFAAAGGCDPASPTVAALRPASEHFGKYRKAPSAAAVACSAVGCAVFGALYGLGHPFCPHGPYALAQAAELSAFGVVAAAALCDARAKIIPFGLSWGLWALAIASALLRGGLWGLASAAKGALAVSAVLLVAWAALRLAGKTRTAGKGDIRTIPAIGALCDPIAAVAGFGAAVALQGAWGVLLVATGRMGKDDPIPMGPFLALWLGAALALPALAPLAGA